MPTITKAETAVRAAATRRRLGYLWQLCQRMERTGRTQVPLFRDVCAACDALHSLWVTCHDRGRGVTIPAEPVSDLAPVGPAGRAGGQQSDEGDSTGRAEAGEKKG